MVCRKRFTRTLLIFALCAMPATLGQNTPDHQTRRWWASVQYLASDAMEGRDTGSAAYQRAAEWVARQFSLAGLKPAGSNGYLQPVPMHQIALISAKSQVSLVRGATAEPLKLLNDITVTPNAGAAGHLDVPLIFAGYGISEDDIRGLDLKGKGAVVFGGLPKSVSLEDAALQRRKLLSQAGALAIVTVVNPRAIEPARWPVAYARSVRLREKPAPPAPVQFTLSAAVASRLFAGSGHAWSEIVDKGAAGGPLPSFEVPARLTADLEFEARDIESPNVLAVLPGNDPALKNEFVVLSAHLDGYGYGEPINGDNLYNGALDDAAYVSTLIEFARLAKEKHRTYRRSVLLAAFTGEEKGLLGSEYFAAHPTVAREQMVANVNLDQLRPIFPLRILTVEGLSDSSLGETAHEVAQRMNIETRPDLEPQRNLFRRADNYNFIKAGVPAVGFIFGYDPGSPEEKIYRAWYAERYHRPSDDINTPLDFTAAARMNTFIYDLIAAIANADARPTWNRSSRYKPKAAEAPEH